MGNLLSGPHRRGLPATRRALVPGAVLGDVRDGDVVVLSLDGTHLRLDVVIDEVDGTRVSISGRDNDNSESHHTETGTVDKHVHATYALVPEGQNNDGLGNAANHVVVDTRGKYVAFRSVAAGDLYLCCEYLCCTENEAGASGRESDTADNYGTRLRFRDRKHVRRRGLWSWRFDHASGSVMFAPKRIAGIAEKKIRARNENDGAGDANALSTRPAFPLINAVGPKRTTRIEAASAWVTFLRNELVERSRLRLETQTWSERAVTARDEALTTLRDALRSVTTNKTCTTTRTRKRLRRDELRFLDGLTGVVDALRDTVVGASMEPVGVGVLGDDDAGNGDGRNDGKTFRKEGTNGKDGPRLEKKPEKQSLWRVDASHLCTVSRVWDLSVTEFRASLQKHKVDDTPVAALQDAIQRNAYEHFVVTGMRRYLLNRDEGDDGDGDGEWDDLCRGGIGANADGADSNSKSQKSLAKSLSNASLVETSSVPSSAFSSLQPSPTKRKDDQGLGKGFLFSSESSLNEKKKSEWEQAVLAESETRRDNRLRRATRRARLKARARAGAAAVDFRQWKVGSLREQLERSGVDAGPLAALVHCLAHASREQRSELFCSSADFRRVDNAERRVFNDTDGYTENEGNAKRERFKIFLARETLSEDLQYLRQEDITPNGDDFDRETKDSTELATRHERVLHAMKSPQKISRKLATEASRDDAAYRRKGTVRAAASAAAAAAATSARERIEGRDVPAAALALVTFVSCLSLSDLRTELTGNFLLAGGLDECVDALVETEWEGGDDGYIGVRGERASNVVKSLTVNQFKKRLADHGLEGSLLELNLLTDALATALASND